ncbi:ABC transporter substrate-binding protein [Falsiroseomonas selenitidurans]|uniref:ABC transporter substrate-binding protein n=1 Tax=Falsiroseomonas selenitidurans TaxID=2716335 RepID=A0ABX1ED29_9PROT|nr:ABC transporter substrate-binding protein [Falsiroseomonas selenitidurans]NKC33427.1 ABC transporter substrate-binding protein [Falsiroseomonas selenitidurans]
MTQPTRRALLGAASLALAAPAWAQTPGHALLAADWPAVQREARGQTVFLNAWGGDDRTNAFLAWAGGRVQALHGVAMRHVRLRDTAEAVARVVAEKAAGRTQGGSVDLIWINGPNFLAMKEQGLHFGPFLDRLPNARFIDRLGKPSTIVDFTVPVEGLAAPWRMAQVAFIADSARVPQPPRSMAALLDWARANPGRTTHPQVRNFMGVTFLKQALHELAPDKAALLRPACDATLRPAADALWAWYDQLRPHLWRGGRAFPANGPAQRPLMLDGELDIYISFNPAEAAVAIANGQLPETARPFVLAGGTLGNTSFVSIPFNAAHAAGAMLVADFLLSAEAQAQAADPRVLGSPTVLDLAALPPEGRARFAALPAGPAILPPEALGRPLQEPHPSWMTRLTAEWEDRYGR